MPSRLAVCLLALLGLAAPSAAQTVLPNFVVIFCDDLGYGDLGCQGHPTIRTPVLDRLAAEGQRWTNFYAAAPVCTPSRAALLTGRLPIRSGLYSDTRRVLSETSIGGLPQSEWTLAEALGGLGYRTTCIGKWHLGHMPQFLPHRQGFDSFYGLPYSNDMNPTTSNPWSWQQPQIQFWNVPLLRDDTVVERPADQRSLTRRYTDEAIHFIRRNRSHPFFLYLAHTMPHVPLFPSPAFDGRSERGRYGDVVEEIDANVGRLLDEIRAQDLDGRTLVVFTSDNGPWLAFGEHGGSAGLLRGGKGGTAEGGMRVPAIFWWPGHIAPGIVSELGCTMDLLPSFVSLAGGGIPPSLTLDGFDISPAWLGTGSSPRETMFYYRGSRLFAVRHGQWKAHFYTKSEYGPDPVVRHDPPLLFHVGRDPSERYECGAQHPEIVAGLQILAREHLASVTPAPSQIDL